MYVPKCFQTNTTKEELIKKMKNKETLEEAAEIYANKELSNELTSKVGNFYGFSSSFIEGAEWQQDQAKILYSEEEVISLLIKREYALDLYDMANDYEDTVKWFEQFKNK